MTRRPVATAVRRGIAAAAAATFLLAAGIPATGPMATATPDAPQRQSRYLTGWLPYWNTDAAVASYLAHAELFREISPFWHYTRWDPTTRRTVVESHVSASTRSSVLARLRTAGRPVIPSVTDGTSSRRMSRVMADPQQRARHVRQLVALVEDNGYDGVDLDYEGFAFRDPRTTWARTREAWVTFIRELGDALHARKKMLTVAIPPMCDEALRCGGQYGYWVYASDQIAPFVDRIRIMTYDYSWDAPGPISPAPWTRAVAEYAARTIPRGKVEIGAPTYGYDWVRRADSATGYLLTGDCPRSGRSAPAAHRRALRAMTERDEVSGSRVSGLRASVGDPPVTWDAESKNPWFRYRDATRWTDGKGRSHRCVAHREVWFSDPRTMAVKARLVDELGLGGLAMWDLGYENPRQWPVLRRLAPTN